MGGGLLYIPERGLSRAAESIPPEVSASSSWTELTKGPEACDRSSLDALSSAVEHERRSSEEPQDPYRGD